MTGAYRALSRAVFEKEFKLFVRYWLNTVSGLATTYIMFVLVFLGGRAAAPDVFGDTLPTIIVGFFVWSMAFGAFQDPSRLLMDEAQWGTLEQLYMTPLGLDAILAIRTVASLVLSFVTGLLLLALMMVTSGQYLIVDPIAVVPLSVLAISTAAGLGFAVGGVAVLYKRIENLFLVVQFLLIGVLAAPSEPLVFDLLPLKLGFDMLVESMEQGRRLWEFPAIELAGVVLVALAYLAVGWVVHRYCLRIARSRGLMGDY